MESEKRSKRGWGIVTVLLAGVLVGIYLSPITRGVNVQINNK